MRAPWMPCPARLRVLVLGLALCAGALAATPSRARADLGGFGALVLPEMALRIANTRSEAHLGWSLTLAPLAPRSVDLHPIPLAADQLLNVVNLFGRGLDVGLLAPEDGLATGQLLFQLRTSLGSRRVLLRCVVRFL